MNCAQGVCFSVYGVMIEGRNNRNRDVKISGVLQVEHNSTKIPLFLHLNGVNRTVNGEAVVHAFESFSLHASLTEPTTGALICDNKISDAMFLKDYAPLTLKIEIDGHTFLRRFSYARLRMEIDHERDRILFYKLGKAS
jgi:hypothetical protein